MLAECEVQPIRRLHRDLVMVLIRQDDGAAVLERAPGAGAVAELRRLFARTDPVRLVEGVFGPIGHRLVEPAPAEPPEAADGQTERPVPRVADVDGLVQLCASMHDTVRAEVRLVRAVLGAVASEDEAEDEVRQAFHENLTDVLQAARRGRDLARAGQPLDALNELTGIETTLPEHGIPGRGFRPYLREQAFELARAALRHRAAVTDWCATVECREGRV